MIIMKDLFRWMDEWMNGFVYTHEYDPCTEHIYLIYATVALGVWLYGRCLESRYLDTFFNLSNRIFLLVMR